MRGMHRKTAVLSALALGFIFFTAVAAEQAATSEETQGPRDCRLIINWDEASMWTHPLTYLQRGKEPQAENVKALLEEIVDEHAKAKVDRLVHCVFALSHGTVSPGFKSFYRHTIHMSESDRIYVKTGIRHLEQAGYDLIQVILDRAHENKMEFVAGMRMNDRHQGSTQTPFYKEHPEWKLEGFSGGLDYKYEGVRKPLLAFAEEFLERYDVDGIELDWLRWCHMFTRAEAEQNAGILTGFVAQMRKVVDQAAGRRGRTKLLLGVRVPQTIDECKSLGFDVRAWVQDGLVDYLCPSDFFYTDFNMRTEDFVALTSGTNCKVYPTVHPVISQRNDHQVHSPASYRAAAKNHYAFGADGISSYNYQYNWYVLLYPHRKLGSVDAWPRAFGYLTELRDEQSVSRGDRHYMYHPLWDPRANTGAVKHDVIELARDDASPSGTQRLRMAEDLESPQLFADLEFKVTGMAADDQIAIEFNGQRVPAENVERTFDPDGQSKDEGRELPGFYLYRFPLGSPPAKSGDNELAIRLTNSAGTDKLVAQEFEIMVRDERPR